MMQTMFLWVDEPIHHPVTKCGKVIHSETLHLDTQVPIRRPALKTMSEKKCKCTRMVVSLQKSFENDQFEKLFRKGIQAITPEEYERIPQFRYREDALASLFGRLFLRQATRRFTEVDWKDIRFGRTDRGKPYLIYPENTTFGLNVSHQGDFVAFASSCTGKVGVDIMRLDKERNNKSADEYINSMAKNASPEELRVMRSQPTEAMKMTVFYRYWCLKEAILKATGEGILKDLSRIDFRINPSDRYRPGCFLTSTTVLEDGSLQDQWVFEETFIEGNHSAAVCKEKNLPRGCMFRQDGEAKLFFSRVTFEWLLEGSEVLNPLPSDGQEAYEQFTTKPRKTF